MNHPDHLDRLNHPDHPPAGRRRRATAAAAVLAAVAGVLPALAAGPAAAVPPAPAAGTASAATPLRWPQPWGAAARLTGTSAERDVRGLVVLPDGSAVTLWTQKSSPAAAESPLYAAVRRAGTDTWGAPARLTAPSARVREVKVVAAGTGAVAVWTEAPDAAPGSKGGERIVSSGLTAGGWSAPAPVAGSEPGRTLAGLDLAAGRKGTVTAVWTRGEPEGETPREVHAATRSAAGAWSAGVRVSVDPTGQDGAIEGGAPHLAVDARGNTVVAYAHVISSDAGVPYTATLPAGASTWNAPVRHRDPFEWSRPPRLAAGPDGTVALIWSGYGSTGKSPVQVKTTRDAAAGWPDERSTVQPDGITDLPEPQLSADGAITLVGRDRLGGYTYATTLAEGARTWSEARDLTLGGTDEQYDVSTGPDGTVRAVWAEHRDGPDEAVLVQGTRGPDGTWTTSRLKTPAGRGFDAEVAAGPDGRAVAVWSRRGGQDANTLWTARTVPQAEVVSAAVPALAKLAGTTSGSRAWAPVWKLDRPVSAWSLALTDRRGETVRTLSGSTTTSTVAPVWNGRTAGGALPPNGPLSWHLSVTPASAAGRGVLAAGRVTVTGGRVAARDLGGPGGLLDGTGDLLARTADGGIRTLYGDRATGTFKGGTTGAGWAKGTRPVPLGDVNGDRCNDVLAALPGGELRLYTPACGAPLTPGTRHKVLGQGWNRYDVLTSPGDVDGDGRADLVAREGSTGRLYVFGTTRTGLKPRVAVSGTFKGYKKIVGAGDLDGDGLGDLLLQDEGNALWRMDGKGRAGSFFRRVLLDRDWGRSYDAVVGVGDLTGDGWDDLVARDRTGRAWRYSGNAEGRLRAPVRIATGWQGYTGLF
ncbi:FG-GAP-like repeat-containing protein [Streptomyces sp. NPDC093225]|uniref:FG-GAP-like repeat-containing protein n=1 Tax=Streptomyces sp. NPDC093225 TaxID=3366034 RepID=UPI0038090FC5